MAKPKRVALVGAWIACLLVALGGLWRYKLTPGEGSAPLARWPTESGIERSADSSTLLLFAHPRCPCTRASLTELSGLLSRFGDKTTVYVIFLKPAGVSTDWSQTGTWTTAMAMRGVHVITDVDGREAALFNVTTSGHVLLYSADGRALYSGGITPARGHEGASAQKNKLAELLAAQVAPAGDSARAPVYGCSLRDTNP